MSIRTINDPSGLNIPLVERLIGMTSYDIVKFVALNMDMLSGIRDAADQIALDKDAVLEALVEGMAIRDMARAINTGYFETVLNPPPVDAEEGETYWVRDEQRIFLARNVGGTGIDLGLELATSDVLQAEGLPVYPNNQTAAQYLPVGSFYRTPSGQLMVVFA